MGGYRIASKLLKGKFNRLAGRVIDLDNVFTWMLGIRVMKQQLPIMTIIFNQYSAFSLLNLAVREETY